jgi:GTPase
LANADTVVAEVEVQRSRIDAEEVVLVGAVGQLRLGAAGGDALAARLLVSGAIGL